MLKHMNAQEPYIAYLDGHLVQSRVSMRSVAKGHMPGAYQRVLEVAMETMQNVRSSACIMEAVEVFQKYLKGANGLPQLREQQVYAMAAALEYIACRNREEEVTKVQLCSAYGVSRYG
jgi:transcription initiation factor TFIIIB Brf1 subunit/transcription initiation factor TFIIB